MSEWLKGDDQLRANLLVIAKQTPRLVGQALYQEALIERTESMRRTPVDTGALRGSHEVQPPVYHSDGDVSVGIVVGGPAAPYAVYVHENLDAHHPVGQAKFLESTLRDSAPFMPARLMKRLEINKMRGLKRVSK